MIRLRLGVTAARNFKRKVVVRRGGIGNLVTQADEYLLTQSGIGLEINQPVDNLIEEIVTQDGLFLATQSGDVLQRNQL
tara:strand:+ start:180 stop:416 length:237 start_codon:yes stop_codon:yes gene_type:complete